MEQWWNDIDRGKLKNLEENLFHCHFVHHRLYMNYPGQELGPPL
jgi:hypothetical protein